MFYYLYQITNLVNDKIYVGVHKTHDMNDGYMGSGKVIKRAIEKYGTGNFRKDIQETFQDAKSMYAREKELVTEEFIAREDVYNLRRGGHGGFDYINKNITSEQRKEYGKRGSFTLLRGEERNKIMRERGTWEKYLQKLSNTQKELAKKKEYVPSFKGKKHTEQIKKHISEIMRIKQKGEKNSQYGTMWITNGKHNKKIKKDDFEIYKKEGYINGRTII